MAFRRIDAAEVVSFDVFDTLLVRDSIDPADVFRLVPGTGPGFAQRRIEAERIAKQLRRDVGEAPEVTLDQVYAVLARLEGRPLDKGPELDVERRVLRVRAAGLVLHRYARAAGKRLFAVSDTCFEAEELASLLAPHGLVFDDLLVSSTSGGAKYDGVLFRHLTERAGVLPERIVHIGDNEVADVEAATRAGLCAVHLPKNHERLRGDATFDADAVGRLKGLGTFPANHLLARAARRPEEQGERSRDRLVGELQLGPAVHAACRWLIDTVRLDRLEGLVLVAEEGSLLETALRCLAPTLPVHVLTSSRRSMLLADAVQAQVLVRRQLAAAGLADSRVAVVAAGPGSDIPRALAAAAGKSVPVLLLGAHSGTRLPSGVQSFERIGRRGGGVGVFDWLMCAGADGKSRTVGRHTLSVESCDGAMGYVREVAPLDAAFTSTSLQELLRVLTATPLVRTGRRTSALPDSPGRRLRQAGTSVPRVFHAVWCAWRVGGAGLLWRMARRLVLRTRRRGG